MVRFPKVLVEQLKCAHTDKSPHTTGAQTLMDKPPISELQSNDEKQNNEDRLALEAVHALCQFGRNQLKAIDKNNDGYGE